MRRVAILLSLLFGVAARAQTPAQVPPCELHVFPTSTFTDASPDYGAIGTNYGLVGLLIAAAETSAQQSGNAKLIVPAIEQMKTYLSPEVQMAVLKSTNVVSALKLAPDTIVVAEPPIPTDELANGHPDLETYRKASSDAKKHNVAIASSTSRCYRELIVDAVSVTKGMGKEIKLSAAFIYRTFDDQHHESHLYDGARFMLRPGAFPATTPDGTDAASAALRAAFAGLFAEWAIKRGPHS